MKHCIRKTGVLAALWLVGIGAGHAQALFTARAPSPQALASDDSWRALAANPTTAEATVVAANADLVRADADTLVLPIAGVPVKAWRLDSYVDGIGNLVWSGISRPFPWRRPTRA